MNAQQKRYLDLIKTEPYKFGHWVGFNDLTELHNDWLKTFLFAKDDQTLLAHRGSFKTTDLAIAIALMIVLYPHLNIIFFRKTDTDVIEIVKQVSKILQSDHFRKLVFVLYGIELILTKDTNGEIDTNLHTNTKGTSQLVGMGINTSITGKHADIVITDDIVNVRDRVSRAEREQTKLQYQELQNVKNRGGRFINTGTPWHKEDAISLMPNVKRFDCYSTGLISKEQLQALRDSMTPSLFAANYELKHIANEDAMFTAATYIDNVPAIYDGLCHIDAAYGGKDGTAFTIIKETDKGFVAYGKRWNKHVDDCIDEIIELHKYYRAGTIYAETNADKGYLAKALRDRGLFVEDYHENQNKMIKIATYLRKYWSQIEWIDDTDPDYMSEVLDYTENAEHDDAPDSAASLIRQIKSRTKWLY
ncbi:hypothetical protein [Vagococcus lutrae]|uniref:hypothetical protein n=1 Tax=Vagococcus lutrae TaxID=81947 RepID=UPI00288F764B|nr:hypothetical protein [Vagococcus lutrae]MDT2841873.1 hypothetical protein [Vagococcus lutrae]